MSDIGGRYFLQMSQLIPLFIVTSTDFLYIKYYITIFSYYNLLLSSLNI